MWFLRVCHHVPHELYDIRASIVSKDCSPQPLGRPDVCYPENSQSNFYFWKCNTHTVHQFQDPKLNVSSAAPTAGVRMTTILLLFVVNEEVRL